ncbi:MAG: beta-phosphoglucomutase [Spirochaetia bacterium]|jgi:beta-phosphoglucomutase|nr:beta-phosphoglucomutase [Spirochaetia bacterium]
MNKAWIFDLDGVICHTDEFHFQAWKRISDELHLDFDRTLNDKLRGVSRRNSLEIILEANHRQLPESSLEEAMEKKNGYYRASLMQLTPADLEPEVKHTLGSFRSEGRKMAIGSSSKNARLILDRLEITDLFDAIVDGTMISKSKPDPEVFLIAAHLLGYLPSDCFVVEDAVAGIQAALRGGMLPIAYRLHEKELPRDIQHAESFADILSIDSKFSALNS